MLLSLKVVGLTTNLDLVRPSRPELVVQHSGSQDFPTATGNLLRNWRSATSMHNVIPKWKNSICPIQRYDIRSDVDNAWRSTGFRIGFTSFHRLHCGSNRHCGQVRICSSRLSWWYATPYPCGSTRLSWECVDLLELCGPSRQSKTGCHITVSSSIHRRRNNMAWFV